MFPRKGGSGSGTQTTRWLLAALTCVLTGGCAAARIGSKQPFEGGSPRASLVVEWALAEEDLRLEAERALCDELAAIADCDCHAATEYFFHVQPIPEKDYLWKLDMLEADGVLAIMPDLSRFPDDYEPLSRSHKGYSSLDPFPRFIVKLWSHPEAEELWGVTASGGFQSENRNILDMSRTIAHELLEAEIVAPATEPTETRQPDILDF